MKTLIVIFTALSLTVSAFAQKPHKLDKESYEKIKALKVAYITEGLDLTTAEAEKFWPIYNTFEEKRYELKRRFQNDDFETISEAKAKQVLEQRIEAEETKHKLEQQFIRDLQEVLSAKKIIMLEQVEHKFRKKMFEEFKRKRNKN